MGAERKSLSRRGRGGSKRPRLSWKRRAGGGCGAGGHWEAGWEETEVQEVPCWLDRAFQL